MSEEKEFTPSWFGAYEINSQGLFGPPESAGKSYHLSLKNGDFIRIKRNHEDGFRFSLYTSINGTYRKFSHGRVSDSNWRKLLEDKL
jgi:hypothetical protein